MFKNILLILILFVGISDSLASASPIPQEDAWVESMITEHFTGLGPHSDIYENAHHLLEEITPESRDWFKRMGALYVAGNWQNHLQGLHALNSLHPSLRDWVEAKMNKYDRNAWRLLDFLSRISVESREWFDQKEVQYIDPLEIAYDESHPSIFSENTYNFILYAGTTIVSVLMIEFLNGSEAALRLFATDTPFQGKGYGTYLLKFLEKWIKEQGRSVIHVHANLRAEKFYRTLGYVDMPFDDVSMTEDIIDLGKRL